MIKQFNKSYIVTTRFENDNYREGSISIYITGAVQVDRDHKLYQIYFV